MIQVLNHLIYLYRSWRGGLTLTSPTTSSLGEKTPLVVSSSTSGGGAAKGKLPILPSAAAHSHPPSLPIPSSSSSEVATDALLLLRHFLVTLILLMIAYHFAISVPGVAFIWSLCGSSMGFLLCLAMPAAFYLKVGPIHRI